MPIHIQTKNGVALLVMDNSPENAFEIRGQHTYPASLRSWDSSTYVSSVTSFALNESH